MPSSRHQFCIRSSPHINPHADLAGSRTGLLKFQFQVLGRREAGDHFSFLPSLPPGSSTEPAGGSSRQVGCFKAGATASETVSARQRMTGSSIIYLTGWMPGTKELNLSPRPLQLPCQRATWSLSLLPLRSRSR